MERRAKLFDTPELGEVVKIEITKPLPTTGVVDSTYKIEGSVKIAGIGAPPWVYGEVRMKEWWKPEAIEEVSYLRGFPMPITGGFSIDFRPAKEGDYEVIVVATPAPLSLPVIGVEPVVGKSAVMKVTVGERPPAVFRFSGVNIDGHDIPLTNHHVDSGLLLEKTTADYLDITPAYEWTGPEKAAVISIKAGYKSWILGFEPKTGAYTQSITLPESPTEPYAGELDIPIRIPLTACGGLTDGAVEIVLKIADFPDYISHIWNVYATKVPPEEEGFRNLEIIAFESELGIGSTCHVKVNFDYRGPGVTKELYAAIGIIRLVIGFDEKIHGSKPWSIPSTPSWKTYEATVDIPITAIDLGTYSLYAKIDGLIPDAITPEYEDVITITEEVPPPPIYTCPICGAPFPSQEELDEHMRIAHPPEPPEVDTLAPRDITHDTATLRGELIETGRCVVVYCYFEWGKTTDYGEKTPEERMDSGDIGNIFWAEPLHELEPNTTYHFRAVGVTRCEAISPLELYSYGPDRSFPTSDIILEGFTMRVRNAPTGATDWRAGYSVGDPYPWIRTRLPLGTTWEWEPSMYYRQTTLPDTPRDFFIVAMDSGGVTLQFDKFPFRIRPGKDYVWDFAAHEMRDDGKVWPPY